jgi:hypothetical protein
MTKEGAPARPADDGGAGLSCRMVQQRRRLPQSGWRAGRDPGGNRRTDDVIGRPVAAARPPHPGALAARGERAGVLLLGEGGVLLYLSAAGGMRSGRFNQPEP